MKCVYGMLSAKVTASVGLVYSENLLINYSARGKSCNQLFLLGWLAAAHKSVESLLSKLYYFRKCFAVYHWFLNN